jgi:hypothetical protein
MATWRPEFFVFPEAGASRAAPALVAPGDNRVDLLAVTNPRGDLFGARRLAHFAFQGDGWGTPSYVANRRLRDTAPAAISRRPGLIDVFAVGADDDDGKLLTWWNWTSGDRGWEGPTVLPGDRGLLSRAAPAVVAWEPERLDAFGISNPHALGPRQLVHWWWDGGWHGPELHAGRLLDISPAAVSRHRDQLDVFVVGADELEGRVLTYWWNRGWGGPAELPGQRSGLVAWGGPAAVSTRPDRLDVVAVSRDGSLLHWWWDGDWHGPSVHTPRPKLDPAGRPWIARVPGADSFEVFATQEPDGIAGSRYIAHWRVDGGVLAPQGSHFTWQNAFGPAAAHDGRGRLHLASGRDDGKVSTSLTDDAYRPPDPPSLRVTALSTSSMRLDWTIPPRTVRTEVWSKSYILLADTSHRITSVPVPQTSFEERGLWPGGARYCYFVRAVDELGGFGQSTTECAQGTSVDVGSGTVPPPSGFVDLGFAGGVGIVLDAARPDTPFGIVWVSQNFGTLPAPAHQDTLVVFRSAGIAGGAETVVHHVEIEVPLLPAGGQHPHREDVTLPAGEYRAVVVLNSDGRASEATAVNNETFHGFRLE